MSDIGKLRYTTIKLIDCYREKFNDWLSYFDGKTFDIFNNNGLVSRLTFDPTLPKIKIRQENHPLNNDLRLIGFYQIE